MTIIRRFGADRSGNFAIILALASIPIFGGLGLAVDYANASRMKSDFQQALDSASVAIAREGKAVTEDEARDIAITFIGENYKEGYTIIDVSVDSGLVTLEAKTVYDTTFARILGYNHIPIDGTSQAATDYHTNEIALVLDTTGSMEGGKLQSLKDAVKGMIDDMAAQNSIPEGLKFALVPFSDFVNVGPQHGPTFKSNGMQNPDGASWLDLNGDVPVPQLELVSGLSRFQLYKHLGQTWPGCVESRVTANGVDYAATDDTPKAAKPETLFVPAFNIDEPSGYYPNSYIDSNVDPFDTTPAGVEAKLAKYGVTTSPSGKVQPATSWTPVTVDTSTSYFYGNYHRPKGPGYSCSSQPLTPLTTNYSALKSKVNSLQAAGSTNIAEGVAWGWRVLSPGEPFTEGRAKKTSTNSKILVVLSDGANSFSVLNNNFKSAYSSYGYLVDARITPENASAAATNAKMDELTLKACGAAKMDGIEIYTISLEINEQATLDMLEACASDKQHFFNLPSRSMLDDAFKQIKDKIAKVRLTG